MHFLVSALDTNFNIGARSFKALWSNASSLFAVSSIQCHPQRRVAARSLA
jgi:hypothetical protein